MFQTEVVEITKTHILCSITFFETRAIYEIMWKNIVEGSRPQMTIWRMRIACWITIATDTNSEYVILIVFSSATMVARNPLSVTLSVLFGVTFVTKRRKMDEWNPEGQTFV